MTRYNRPTMRRSMILLGVVVLVAAHALILHVVGAHGALPLALVSGLVLLVAVAHFGALGPVYALLRRRRARPPSKR